MTFSFFSKWKKGINNWYRNKISLIPQKTKESVLARLSVILNYLANSILLAIPLSIILSVNYLVCVICLWVLIPYIESYYVWFRERWKDDLAK